MSATMEKQPNLPVSEKKRRTVRIVLVAFLICVTATIGSTLGYQHYHATYTQAQSQAQMGIKHLRRAETLLESLQKNPWNAQAIEQARQEFTSASIAFTQLNGSLKSLPPGSSALPVYGNQLSAVSHLVPAVIQLSQAGIVGCQMLKLLVIRLHNLANGQQGVGLSMADMANIKQDVQSILTAVTLATQEVGQVNPADVQVNTNLKKMLGTFSKEVPQIQTWIAEVNNLLPVLPTLLGAGTPTNYLVEILDTTELRPGGGFIGNYGIITLSGGRLTTAHITDTSLLDRPYEVKKSIAYPAAYAWFDIASQGWSFRDSNLDADFPTSARNGEQTYMQEGGNVPVQGVIAMTPTLLQHVLTITGPIYVPEYQETVTSSNLIARIHFHQLIGIPGQGDGEAATPDGHSSLRKRFTELLGEHVLAHIRQLPSSSVAKLFQLAVSSLHTKDLQLYFNASPAENLLQRNHLDAAIQAPPGDNLFVVDANISGNKANSLISTSINDQVMIDETGNAVHRTTLHYAWTLPGPVYGSPLYRDYARVYLPPGSTLQSENGWQPRGVSNAFGREVRAGFFTLTYGKTVTIILVWSVHNAAKKDTSGWHYQYLIQKQVGTQWKLQVQVKLPACATVQSVSGGMIARGKQEASLTQTLNTDMSTEVNYSC
jgi:hypothetical protein